ncbi:low molecular weight protein-tyrosine-phosphatase [uncultured Cloacibacillus sp.]|uniref:low molecular weight protein-tyrosine-phosphatase n=1 Tax=uncultured Cloacibacillus sp. TaxID=889794 RepID=UPI00258E2D5A|nr:low molecular weight protein-tyrosine-phosphatase [uncultured Cloacibacillus sp.]
MLKIMFVCHGNICRSPMAEFVMKDIASRRGLADKFLVMSSAASAEEVGSDMHEAARARLREEGVPFERRRAVQLTRADYGKFDYIIGMDGQNIRNILRICGGDPEDKVWKLMDFTDEAGEDVADPWYTGNFTRAYDDIRKGCEALMARLKSDGAV